MITIRTGANGSYKSAYTVWFTILRELKNGRTVVTNFEGMEPLDIIAKRLNIEFPETAKLIRIFSRDENGIFLWQHFFCWCPLHAQIVIDECQDIFSKNIGFRGEKIKYRPLEDFLPHLPEDYESFFNSRHVPVDLTKLKPSEIDDRGKAEYDENGRIIYPLTYNEGFMRHRKYNWDIELLSPDWTQIDQQIKACAEQCFFHQNNDGFIFSKRKPYIFKHDKTVAKPTLPKGKNANLFKEKIPLEVHLLYKSTGTGAVTKSGGMNTLFKSPKFVLLGLFIILAIGYLIYAITTQYIINESPDSAVPSDATSEVLDTPSTQQNNQAVQDTSNVHPSGDSNPPNRKSRNAFLPVTDVLFFDGLERAYFSGFHRKITRGKGNYRNKLDVVINAYTATGMYSINNRYLDTLGIEFEIMDECLLKLTSPIGSTLLTCEPYESPTSTNNTSDSPSNTNVADLIKDNQLFM